MAGRGAEGVTEQRRISGKGHGKPPKGKPFVKGAASPNPAGRPKDAASVTYWLKTFAGMSPVEVAEHCEIYAKELRRKTGNMTTAAIIAARAIMTLMDETDPKVLAQLLDRTDGKLATTLDIHDWRETAKAQGLTDADIEAATEQAATLFEKIATGEVRPLVAGQAAPIEMETKGGE